MKLTCKRLDDLIRIAKGKRAVENKVARSKRFSYERYRLSDGSRNAHGLLPALVSRGAVLSGLR